MGGIVFSRKQRRSLTQTVLDLAGVLPFPRSVLLAHTGIASIEDGRTSPIVQDQPLTVQEQMKVWYTFRSALEPSLQDRKLSEIIGWSLAFLGLLISLSDAQDIPIFTGALERLKACVPPQEELDQLEAAESKQRRTKERHNAIRKVLSEQLRQKIAQAKRDATREAAAVAAGEAAGEPSVKTEPNTSVSSTPAPMDISVDESSASKLESSTLETAVGSIKVEDLLASEGQGQTFTSGGKRMGRPVTVGLNSDTATLMTPALVRGQSTQEKEITVDALQEEYDDPQERFEAAEEVAHYARFQRDCLKATLAHFPSLSEDIPYVKYLAKRCKRWARFMILAMQMKLELNEFEMTLEQEEKDRAYIISVCKKYLPANFEDEPVDAAEETAIIEGQSSVAEEEKAEAERARAAAAADAAANSSQMTDVASSGQSDAHTVPHPPQVAPPVPTTAPASTSTIPFAHRRIMSHLAKASISDLKTVPFSLLAKLLRRTVTRMPPRKEDVEKHGPIMSQIRFPAHLERTPIWWWGARDDFDYLLGLSIHGTGFENIAADPKLGFRSKLAEFVWEEKDPSAAGAAKVQGEEDSEEDDDKHNSPQKKKAPPKAAVATIKEEDEPMPSSSTATTPAPGATPSKLSAAAGFGCVCQQSRWAKGTGRTCVCISCHYWYHKDCVAPENIPKLRLSQFLPLPPGHPLAPALGSSGEAGVPHANGDEGAAASSDLSMEPMSRQASLQSAVEDSMDIDKEKADDSDTQSEGEAAPARARRSGTKAAAKPATTPSASPVPVADQGFRCPRCNLQWPVMRALELRMRVLTDHLARVRRHRVRAKEKLLRVLDETNFHASLSSGTSSGLNLPGPSRPRSSAAAASSASSDSTSILAWSKKEKHSFIQALHTWGTAFFTRGGYHVGVPVLEALLATSGSKSPAMVALASNSNLNKRSQTQLQQFFDRLLVQATWVVEKARRDMTALCVRRKNARLIAEHKELVEARKLLVELQDKASGRAGKYCFCRGRAADARANAASKSRRRRPEELLIGCDDGSSLECKAGRRMVPRSVSRYR